MGGRIDFVIPWVDGQDPTWRDEKSRYAPEGLVDDGEARYRDWGLLPYWFRGVEKYAPWVRKIHFVTWGHLPAWLHTKAPKLHIVRHEDFIPEQFLPVFSSNPLETHLHRIPGLSERFVYFNDDLMLLRPVKESDFFCGRKPRDLLALQPVIANPSNPVMSKILLNNSLILSRYFKKRETMRRHPGKYFHPGYPWKYFVYNLLELAFPQYTGLYTVHGPSPLLKSTFKEVWEREEEYLKEVSSHRFRSGDDVNQYLFREWEKQKGNFVPANLHRDYQYLYLDDPKKKYLQVIRRQEKKIVCVNDTDLPGSFEETRKELIAAFASILPEKSSFEK